MFVHVHLLHTSVFKHRKKWNLTTGTSHRGLACESSQMIPTSPSCLHISPCMCWPHCDTQTKSPEFLYQVPWTSQKEIPCILQQNISYLENKMFKSHLSYYNYWKLVIRKHTVNWNVTQWSPLYFKGGLTGFHRAVLGNCLTTGWSHQCTVVFYSLVCRGVLYAA